MVLISFERSRDFGTNMSKKAFQLCEEGLAVRESIGICARRDNGGN
jgi:hypothetical protein